MVGTFVDPGPLAPLTACRLVTLDKSPGVRPAGVGEVVRRIISKFILSVIRPEIRAVVGSPQMCVGQKCGNKAAVHALSAIYEEGSTDGVLLVDASSNAFNCLNRKAALANINDLCPALGTELTNIVQNRNYLLMVNAFHPGREQNRAILWPWQCMPQAAYAALIVCVKNKWLYLVRQQKLLGICYNQSKKDVLRHDLIPAITG